jgi:hypothetical protein
MIIKEVTSSDLEATVGFVMARPPMFTESVNTFSLIISDKTKVLPVIAGMRLCLIECSRGS